MTTDAAIDDFSMTRCPASKKQKGPL